MRHPLPFLGGFLAGIFAMYYLDAQSGARRRARVRDGFVAAGHGMADFAQTGGQRAVDRVKGMAATRSWHGKTRRQAEADRQLLESIGDALDRIVRHPGLVQVEVERGRVLLGGHILDEEVETLLSEVRGIAGVRDVRNEMNVHEHEHQPSVGSAIDANRLN